MKHIEGFEDRLLKAINDKGMTNSQVCALTGITWSCMNCYVNEKQMPSCYNLVKLAKVLDVSTDYLLGLTEPAHWISHTKGGFIYAQCSWCGTVHDVRSKYCPHCGRRMKI